MARKPKLYTKLVRRRGGVGTYSSLWLAADHVLQVESTMVTERYQRVWLRDVQGLFIRPSREARWVLWVSLPLAALFALRAVFVEEAAPVFWVFTGLSTMVLLYGLFLARNCHFYVITAVQRMEWANVARYRQARKLMARLEPLILEAQRNETADVPAAGDAAAVSGQA